MTAARRKSARWLRVAGLLGAWMASAAGAAEISVLSAGAVEPGMRAAAMAFEKETGHQVHLSFNTAPQIRKRVAEGASYDAVVAPPALLEELAQSHKVQASSVGVGRVGLGIVVRDYAPVPDIGSVPAFRSAVIQAQSLVFNRASTGLYLEKLLQAQGLYEQVQARVTRYPDGASVMEHVLHGKGMELGFGAITEIMLYREKGLKFVGPLPAELQNYTDYGAAVMSSAPQAGLAQQFVTYLGSPAAKAVFRAAGIE